MGEFVSVAVCTYNGERYIEKQLESIINQTRKPDEIIISDDASTDNTINLINKINFKGIQFRVIINNKNLGVTKNFEQCIENCRGDIIFLSDQDDVWEENKIYKIDKCFKENKDIELIFTNAWIIDENNCIQDKYLIDDLCKQSIFDTDRIFDRIINHNCVTGATVAFKKSLFDRIGFISKEWVQDEWLAINAAIVDRIMFLDEKLIKYRVHSNNQIGLVNENLQFRARRFINTIRNSMDFRKKELARYQDLSCIVSYYNNEKSKYIYKKLAFIHIEYEFLFLSKIKKIEIIIKLIKKNAYKKYSSGVNALLKDICIVFQNKKRNSV